MANRIFYIDNDSLKFNTKSIELNNGTNSAKIELDLNGDIIIDKLKLLGGGGGAADSVSLINNRFIEDDYDNNGTSTTRPGQVRYGVNTYGLYSEHIPQNLFNEQIPNGTYKSLLNGRYMTLFTHNFSNNAVNMMNISSSDLIFYNTINPTPDPILNDYNLNKTNSNIIAKYSNGGMILNNEINNKRVNVTFDDMRFIDSVVGSNSIMSDTNFKIFDTTPNNYIELTKNKIEMNSAISNERFVMNPNRLLFYKPKNFTFYNTKTNTEETLNNIEFSQDLNNIGLISAVKLPAIDTNPPDVQISSVLTPNYLDLTHNTKIDNYSSSINLTSNGLKMFSKEQSINSVLYGDLIDFYSNYDNFSTYAEYNSDYIKLENRTNIVDISLEMTCGNIKINDSSDSTIVNILSNEIKISDSLNARNAVIGHNELYVVDEFDNNKTTINPDGINIIKGGFVVATLTQEGLFHSSFAGVANLDGGSLINLKEISTLIEGDSTTGELTVNATFAPTLTADIDIGLKVFIMFDKISNQFITVDPTEMIEYFRIKLGL